MEIIEATYISEGVCRKIRADLERYAEREQSRVSFGFALRMLLLTPGFQFVLARRLQEGAVKIPIIGRLLRRILWWITCMAFGSEIALGAHVGGGLYIPHPYGIVVGEAKLGRNVSLLQNVTIGRRSAEFPGDPVIGDDVTITAGAVVIGAITIGRGATIGANAVVLKDVPPDSIAIGVPAKIIGGRKTP
jgi:serine O-acetyltransferase